MEEMSKRNDQTPVDIQETLEKLVDAVHNLQNRVDRLEKNVPESLTARLQSIEEHVVPLTTTTGTYNSHAKVRQNKFTHVLAEQVNVVGLREALTWTHKPLKILWVMLLLAGLAATIFYIEQNVEKYLKDNTVSKVSFETQSSYQFPPVLVCPPWPFDKKKVSSMGIPMDALQYTIGYLGDAPTDSLNVSEAKENFLNYYKKHNFTSLPEFFDVMTSDGVDGSEDTDLCLTESVCYSCQNGCNGSLPVKKVIFDYAVCYQFSFPPASLKSSYRPPWLYFRNKHFPGAPAVVSDSQWMVDLLPLASLDGPRINLSPAVFNMKVSVQYIKFPEEAGKCDNKMTDTDERHHQRLCLERCLNQKYDALDSSAQSLNTSRPIDEIDNAYDERLEQEADYDLETVGNATNSSLVVNGTETSEADEEALWSACDAQCRPPCERYLYDLAVEYNAKLEEDAYLNSSSHLALLFEHTALHTGFIVHWEQVDTMTWSDFISNVGGTFGLFLGCTVFTIAQLILSFANYFFEARRD